jgi:two-component system chemotaxis response regulator CheY
MTRTIMVIDDSISLRGMLSITLASAGYEVMEAADGVEALARLEQRSPNLILCDLNMPNMDGLSFTRAIKQHPKHRFLPIVMLTTDNDPAYREEGRRAGVLAWACKPFEPKSLLSTVSRLATP